MIEGHFIVIEGIDTNTGFLRALLRHPDVVANRVTTGFVDAHAGELATSAPDASFIPFGLLRVGLVSRTARRGASAAGRASASSRARARSRCPRGPRPCRGSRPVRP